LKKWLPFESVQCYVFDIQRCFERGNHNVDGLDYVFCLDWVINVLAGYSGMEGIYPRVINLLHEVKDNKL